MALTLAAVLLVLLMLYFVWQTARDQELDLPYSATYTPRETVLQTQLDIKAPPEIIWKTLTSLRDYHLWCPWVRRVRVTNESATRWAHRHSFEHYTPEVGRRFQIRCLPMLPLTSCRFISLDPPNSLSMEMRFFPAIREIVTFSLTPFANLVQIDYRSVSPSVLGFIPQALFSWRGKKVLHNLQEQLPELPPVAEAPEEVLEKEEKPVTDEAHIQQLVAKAFEEGKEILDSISDRFVRAKAKSAYIKAQRSGQAPSTIRKEVPTDEKTPSGPPPEKPTETKKAPLQETSEDDQEAVIKQAVAQALDGNMDAINSISDRVQRARAKAAYIKAKRSRS